MSAFDTTTNTGSTTFTNAYSTVELFASDSVQSAKGFERTSGWRYFEMVIDDQGGDLSTLFVGIAADMNIGPQLAFMWGGLSGQADPRSGVFHGPAPNYSGMYPWFSLSAQTGDVFMFSIDLGGGRDHTGTQRVLTTSDGAGNIMLPLVADVGKNGVWPDTGAPGGVVRSGYSRPAFGVPMMALPFVARDSTSSSEAKVSLRVETTSFAYAIPTGAVAWGDGPEGVPAGSGGGIDGFSLAWDPTIVNRGSLSDANRICIFTATNEAATAGYVMSVNFAGLTGKRYLEVWQSPAGGNGVGPDLPQQDIGLFDASTITNTFFDATPGVNALFFNKSNQVFRRGADISLSVTNEALLSFNSTNLALNMCGMMIDFDNKLFWFCQPYATVAGFGPWVGAHSLSTSGFLPTSQITASPYSLGPRTSYKGIPISITAGTSVLRIGVKDRPYSLGMTFRFYLNGGQLPFITHPLLPGATSLNGGRSVVAGQGDSWDVVNNAASITYGAAGVSALLNNVANNVAQCAQVKSSGKKYFELHLEQAWNITGWYLGLRRKAATTMSHGTELNRIDQGLVVQPLNAGGACWRYGVNIGSWTATGSQTLAPGMAPWHGVAVDFDTGRLWVGTWNYNARTMNWGAASDPATGTNPHLTFTASESLRIFVSPGGSNLRRINLVQDDNNVVGLPAGFTTWGGTAPISVTATPSPSPSATLAAGTRNIWPTGMVG